MSLLLTLAYAATSTTPMPSSGGQFWDDAVHYAPLVAACVGILTACVAVFAVLIAWRSLKASRESVATATRSVDNAEAALRGSVRPILTVMGRTPHSITVHNVGPGVALDVGATVAGAMAIHGAPLYVDWFEEPSAIPVLAPGASETFPLTAMKLGGGNTTFMVLLRCRDVNDTRHWTFRLVGESASSVYTEVETGPYSDRVEQFLSKYREAVAEQTERRQAAHAAWEAEDAAAESATEPPEVEPPPR